MRQYSERWRLVNDSPATGAWNMAVDEGLMCEVGKGVALPVLRFYGWSPACLSLGYGQRIKVVDRDRLVDKGIDVVRRPTGGGAILHADDLTYSVVLPADHDLAKGSLVESYRRISGALVEGLHLLGVTVQTNPADKANSQAVICFETPSHYEPTVAGKKLIGSAQARKHNAVLQHGSIPLSGDIAQICEVLAYESELARERAKEVVRLQACTLTDVPGGDMKTYEEVANALTEGFESVFGITFEQTSLTESELARTEQLTAEKYSQGSWMARR